MTQIPFFIGYKRTFRVIRLSSLGEMKPLAFALRNLLGGFGASIVAPSLPPLAPRLRSKAPRSLSGVDLAGNLRESLRTQHGPAPVGRGHVGSDLGPVIRSRDLRGRGIEPHTMNSLSPDLSGGRDGIAAHFLPSLASGPNEDVGLILRREPNHGPLSERPEGEKRCHDGESMDGFAPVLFTSGEWHRDEHAIGSGSVDHKRVGHLAHGVGSSGAGAGCHGGIFLWAASVVNTPNLLCNVTVTFELIHKLARKLWMNPQVQLETRIVHRLARSVDKPSSEA